MASSTPPRLEIAANARTLRTLLADADGGTRARLAAAVQGGGGNAALQQLVASSGGPTVQRWAVRLPPATTDCERIVSYMNTNSPHRADSGWAKTSVSFDWGGDPAYTESDGVITAAVTGATVTKTVRVDMPQWSPTNPAIARAWGAMYGDLRAHEAEHERIAGEWETLLRTRLAGLTVTVPNRTIAAFRGAVQAEWDAWIAEHQADQTAIDPYTAILDCSVGEGEEGESAPETGEGEEAPEAAAAAEA